MRSSRLFRDFLQRFQLVVADVGSIVFLEPVKEEPSVPPVCGNERSGAASLAAAGKPDALFYDTATQVSIDQTLRHLGHRMTQGAVGQLRLSHPAAEKPCLEHSHDLRNMPLSGIYCQTAFAINATRCQAWEPNKDVAPRLDLDAAGVALMVPNRSVTPLAINPATVAPSLRLRVLDRRQRA